MEYQRVIQENIRKLGKGANLDDLFKLKNKFKQLQKDGKNEAATINLVPYDLLHDINWEFYDDLGEGNIASQQNRMVFNSF